MRFTSSAFKQQAVAALANTGLQKALRKAKDGFILKRQAALDALPEFEQLRAKAIEIKQHTLANLDAYLTYFEQQVIHSGGQVH